MRLHFRTFSGVFLTAGMFLCSATPVATGRLTGGGFILQGVMKITTGFELHCDLKAPNNLEVNWGGNHFHLDELKAATCYDTLPSEKPPTAGFTTLYGAGTGMFNGQAGAYANWQFSDHGEPGIGVDQITYLIISDANGNIVLSAGPAELAGGNYQAHKEH